MLRRTLLNLSATGSTRRAIGTCRSGSTFPGRAAERRLPFDHICSADQYLITFIGGDHMIFSGRARLPGDGAKDSMFQGLICIATTAFWDAYLKGDRRAMTFLADGGLQKVLGKDAAFEKKLKMR